MHYKFLSDDHDYNSGTGKNVDNGETVRRENKMDRTPETEQDLVCKLLFMRMPENRGISVSTAPIFSYISGWT
jgi:hypothetical protein